MDVDLASEEKTLLEHAKEAVIKYNKIRHASGGIDTLYSFLLSENGNVYDGGCFEPNIGHASICGERHAIANLILQESDLDLWYARNNGSFTSICSRKRWMDFSQSREIFSKRFLPITL